MTKLTDKKCVPCEGGVEPLNKAQTEKLLQQIPQWHLNVNSTEIKREFKFKNFYQTMSFVNAIAWIANQENHHPDLEVGYNYCNVRFSTHAIKGLSENDFICAAKVTALME